VKTASVDPDTWRFTIAVRLGRCADDHLGCPCKGDETIHRARTAEVRHAQETNSEAAACPECGVQTSPVALVTWGHCRACRTADSRAMRPLRW
jgi:hypothetical protein